MRHTISRSAMAPIQAFRRGARWFSDAPRPLNRSTSAATLHRTPLPPTATAAGRLRSGSTGTRVASGRMVIPNPPLPPTQLVMGRVAIFACYLYVSIVWPFVLLFPGRWIMPGTCQLHTQLTASGQSNCPFGGPCSGTA